MLCHNFMSTEDSVHQTWRLRVTKAIRTNLTIIMVLLLLSLIKLKALTVLKGGL